MKYKLINSYYNKENGVSYSVIQTDKGIFSASSLLREEDKDVESSFLGCELAEKKAQIKYLQTENRELLYAIHILENLEKELKCIKGYNPHSLEARRLRRKIYELKDIHKEQKENIQNIKENVLKDTEAKLNFKRKFRKDKGKK